MSEFKLQSKKDKNRVVSAGKEKHLRRWMPHLVIAGVWLYLCLPLMLGNRVVGFRDSANLYYPLFQAIDGVWQTSEIPLWNPYCNFGFPTVADGSSSVFYPGKLIFLFRFLSFPSRYGVYLSVHLLLAAIGAYRLARTLNCHRSGACMAGIAYAFGAPVLFQVTNVIYLVSAAWLPFTLTAVWHMLLRGDLRATILCSVYCAMMILGGDPQMVYHVGLIATGSMAVVAVTRTFHSPRGPTTLLEPSHRWWMRRGVGIVSLILLTSGLAAIQILPTEKLARRSERSGAGKIVNIYSAMASMLNKRAIEGENSISESLLRRDSQVVGQYQFSQPPWSLIELAIPNISGKPFPQNGRWASQLPASDRMWYPSLYLGISVLILSISRLRLWGRNQRDIWLSWIGLVFLLGSFGWYGLAWLIHETQLAMGIPVEAGQAWASPVGGVYWWMSTLLPKYFSFRYPAKLFLISSLAISVLAGRGLQGIGKRNPIVFFAAAGILALLTPIAIELVVRNFMQALPTNSNSASSLIEFGPFDATMATRQVYFACFHTAWVLVSIGAAIMWGRRRESSEHAQPRQKAWQAWAVVTILAIDLVVANGWLMAQVPSSSFTQPAPLNFIAHNARPDPSNTLSPQPPTTVVVDPFLPIEFAESSSPDRLEEIILWQRRTLQAKHHLNQRIRLIGSFHSIWPQQYLATIDNIKQRLVLDPTEHSEHRVTLDWGQEFNAKWQVDWNHARFEIHCDREQWVELPLMGDDGWEIQIQTDGAGEPLKVGGDRARISDSDLLNVYLPAGKSDLVLRYQPVEFYAGAWISGIAWSGALACLAMSLIRRKKI